MIGYKITGDAKIYVQVTAIRHTTLIKICKTCGIHFIKRAQLQNELLQITLEKADLFCYLMTLTRTDTQLKLYKVIVARVLLYGCANCKINKADKRRIETAENKFLPRVPCHIC